jgi:signal transduction histidine kinase
VSREGTYLGDGPLESASMLAWFEDRARAAATAGFPALRVVGDTCCVAGHGPGSERLLALEAKLDGLTQIMPLSVLCAYDGHRQPSSLLRDSLPLHPQLLVQDVVCANPFVLTADPQADVERVLASVLRLHRHEVSFQGLLDAVEAERRAVARELHDELGQLLATIQLGLQALVEGQRPAAMVDLEESSALVAQAAESVRSLALDLRPAMLDDLGLAPALRSLIRRQSRRGGFDVVQDLDALDGLSLTDSLSTTCFRVCQEALHNVILHAQAHRVDVSVRRHLDELELRVHDDGVGFDVASRRADRRRLGLLGMEERVAVAGGRLWVESAPGQGTSVRALMPLRPPGGA